MSEKKPKHVIWFMCDQLRWDCLGFTGDQIVRTPTLDRLARNGIVFDNMFIQFPACMPSRASMLTGRYPSTIRMATGGNAFLDPRETTLPEILQRNGFRTGIFGKLHITPQVYTRDTLKTDRPIIDAKQFMEAADLPSIPNDPYKENYGFQESAGAEDALLGEYADWLRDKGRKDLAELIPDRTWFQPGEVCKQLSDAGVSRIPPELHNSTFTAEKAVDFFERNSKQQNCFMEVSFIDPHHPWDPPAELANHYLNSDIPLPEYSDTGELKIPQSLIDRDVPQAFDNITADHTRQIIAYYYAMIELIDRSIGKVVTAVENAGELDDTLFIFCADHGEHLGSHGLFRKGCLHYDHLIKSPCMMSWKNGIPDGQRHRPLMQGIDIMPTILSLLNIPAPPGNQGIDFSPALNGNREFGREWIYCQGNHAPWGPYIDGITIRTEQYKLNYYPLDRVSHLFDLKSDPGERNDLSEKPETQDLLHKMFGLMVQAMYAQNDPLPSFLSQY